MISLPRVAPRPQIDFSRARARARAGVFVCFDACVRASREPTLGQGAWGVSDQRWTDALRHEFGGDDDPLTCWMTPQDVLTERSRGVGAAVCDVAQHRTRFAALVRQQCRTALPSGTGPTAAALPALALPTAADCCTQPLLCLCSA
jgi:hypothetical protein